MLVELLLDYGIPLVLVAVLAILVRFRRSMMELDEHGYHFITSGLGFLALAVVLRVYHQADILAQLRFLSEPMFYRLLFWSAITVGTALLISGLATHLPVMRSARRLTSQRLSGLELIRTIERLVAIEPRIVVLLKTVAEHIRSTYECKRVVVYRRNGGELGNPGNKSLYSLPIKCGNRTEALISLQLKQPLSDDDRLNLSVIAEILARRIDQELLRNRLQSIERFDSLRKQIHGIGLASDNLPRALGSLMSKLRDFYSLDHVNSCLVSLETIRMIRYTIGRTGSVLAEKGLPVPDGLAKLLSSSQQAQRVIASALTNSESVSFGLPQEVRSTVSVCCRRSKDRTVVMLLSSHTADHFGGEEVAQMRFLGDAIVGLLDALAQKRNERLQARRSGKLLALLHRYQQDQNHFSGCSSLVALLQRELHLDIARISVIDNSPSFLTSVAVATREGVYSTYSGEVLLRSSLPSHDRVLTSGRSIVLAADCPNDLISESEADTMLVAPPGVVMILPIRSAYGVVGTLSLASRKMAKRRDFSREERQFVHLIAQIASLMMVEDSRVGASATWSFARSTDRQLRSRLRSSLSGILGSLELIRTAEGGQQDMGHYLQIIDKSARRINDYLMTASAASPVLNEGGEDGD